MEQLWPDDSPLPDMSDRLESPPPTPPSYDLGPPRTDTDTDTTTTTTTATTDQASSASGRRRRGSEGSATPVDTAGTEAVGAEVHTTPTLRNRRRRAKWETDVGTERYTAPDTDRGANETEPVGRNGDKTEKGNGDTEAEGVAGADAEGKKGSAKKTTGNGTGKASKGSRAGSGFERMRERIRSPLISGLKLDDLREQISKNVEVKFAPLHIPPHRRFQTAAVALWALLLPICLFVFFLLMSFPPMWVVLIPYLIWIQFDRAPDHGGRPSQWARGSSVWKYFAQYYPCSIVKEADLPADRPYLFGYHPHGIIGMGAFATFATEGTNFSQLFPGIKPHLLTLESNFKMPFYRDLLLLLGVSSVSKLSCANILAQGPGSAITIVIGGAAESLSAHPGTADLTLKKRYGFIKMAIREGADLVPVFSFGENDIYEQLANAKGSIVYKLQKRFQRVFGFTLPLFYGRGLFNYNYGLMPFRHPIVSVVGQPIHVKRDPHPSDEVVQHVQKLYIEELMRVWHRYKDVYARNRTKELTLVE